MISILIVLLFILAAMIIAKNETSTKVTNFTYTIFGSCLILIAGFRSGQSMPDYNMYVSLYYSNISGDYSYFIEPSFRIIAHVSNQIISSEPLLHFIIYAILGVVLKLFSIKILSKLFYSSVFIYISNYYILHEMVQIRAGVASALILISIHYIYKRKVMQFAILIGVATLFHYSSLLFILLIFLDHHKYNKILYIYFIIAAYVMYYTSGYLVPSIMNYIPFLSLKMKTLSYTSSLRTEALAINVFGIFILTRFIIYFFFSLFSKLIIRHNRYYYILIKMYAFGIILYIAFANYPDIAVRLSYTLLLVEIILIPTITYAFKNRYVSKLLIISYGMIAFVSNIFMASYFANI